jgi:SOS-response transcriptional repressor LexA
MLPTICPGDLVLLDRDEEKRRRPSLRQVYALSLDEGGTLKRCKLEQDRLLVIPDNPAAGFDPTSVSLKARNILDIIQGQVVWIGRELP